MTKKTDNQQKKPSLYTEKEKQNLPLPNELDPNDHAVHVKVAAAALKMKGRLSSNKSVS